VTVTKSITLASDGIGTAGILAVGTNGITVNAPVGSTIYLRKLVIDGGPVGSNSLNGIRFIAGKSLVIENCNIRNFTGGAPNGYGVSFQPSANQTHSLIIRNSTIQNNGVSGSNTGAGVFVNPSGLAVANVSISNSVISQNNAGVRADGSSLSGGGITVSVFNSDVSNNTNGGVAAFSTTAPPVTVIVDHSSVTGNGVGVNANGPATTILRLNNSKVAFNTIGYKQLSSAILSSFGNNVISDNGSNTGTLSTTPGPQ